MHPIKFPEANKTLIAPPGMENIVSSVDAWADGQQAITLWKASWRERFEFLLRGRIWLSFMAHGTMPPAYLKVGEMFEKPAPKAKTDAEKKG